MKISYGISDFKTLREQGYLYVDKTKYIEVLESYDSKYMLFMRPRRFGKSLFLSTLSYYYDINYRDKFDEIFRHLYISKNSIKLRNSYLMLEFNFSGLNTSDKGSLEDSFKAKLKESIIRFCINIKSIFLTYQRWKGKYKRKMMWEQY